MGHFYKKKFLSNIKKIYFPGPSWDNSIKKNYNHKKKFTKIKKKKKKKQKKKIKKKKKKKKKKMNIKNKKKEVNKLTYSIHL